MRRNAFTILIAAALISGLALLGGCGGSSGGGGGGGNAAPTAVDDTITVTWNIPTTITEEEILSNDFDPDGGSCFCVITGFPSHGTLDFAGPDTFIYTPDCGYLGTDTFTYAAFDGEDFSATATVNVIVARQTIIGSVAPFYEHARGWNDYVKNEGGDILEARGIPADGAELGGYSANIHGGELRTVQVLGLSSCDGITASDALGAFDWICNDGTDPVTVVSTGLAEGKRLSDLLDFEAVSWRDNKVTVLLDGELYQETAPAKWWDNPVASAIQGSPAGTISLGSAGTIYVVNSSASSLSAGIVIEADRVGLVIEPGQVLELLPFYSSFFWTYIQHAISASGRAFLWLEGEMDIKPPTPPNPFCSRMENGIYLEAVTFSRLDNVVVEDEASQLVEAVVLQNSSNNLLTRITASPKHLGNDPAAATIRLSNSDKNTLTDVTARGRSNGMSLVTSDENILTHVTVSGSDNHGIYLYGSSTNAFSQVNVSGSGSRGIYLYGSSTNAFSQVNVSGSAQDGIYINGSRYNNFTRVIVSGNGRHGIYVAGNGSHDQLDLNTTSRNAFIAVTAVDNSSNGIYFENSLLYKVLTAATINNGSDGLAFKHQHGSRIYDVVSAHNGRAGIFYCDSAYPPASTHFPDIYKYGETIFDDRLLLGANLIDAVDCGVAAVAATSLNSQAVTGISLEGTFVGPVFADDTVNLSDSDGAALFGSITDWASFENPYRAWGKDGPAFSDTVRGAPVGSDLCRIWDRSLDMEDTVALAALSDPSAADYYMGMGLLRAVEIVGDGVGDDDGLCEGGEDCLATPNIGSYQGHGELVLEDSFLFQSQNVNIYAYSVNGY